MRNLGRGLGIVGLGVCLGVVIGCATGQNKTDWRNGYPEMKVQDDIFKINFEGNTFRYPRLRKCAEVTLENGYKYFIVIDKKSSARRCQITIKCFKEKPENTPVFVYDAEQVKTNIKIHRGVL